MGPGGVHVDTLEDDGHSVHTNDDGTVTIDGETFSSWKEAHDKLDHHGKHFHTKVGRTWNKFPFPALVAPRLSGARHCLRHMGHGALARLSGSRLLRDW